MPSKRSNNSTSTSSNPFEEQWSKRNQTTIRKRSASVLNSKSTGKNNFRDRRIGEKDPNLDEQQRYLLRLQRERSKRHHKKARFSLADTEEFQDDYQKDEADILAEEDDNKNQYDEEENEDTDDFIKLKVPDDSTTENTQRTHQEIMDEVVQKSKMHRAERQHEKGLTDAKTAELDEGLPALMALLTKSSNDFVRHRKEQLGKGLGDKIQKSIFGDEEDETTLASISRLSSQQMLPKSVNDKQFHYEKVYQQLASEKRARPSERLLTEEEKAEKDREELAEFEKQRKQRMTSLEDDDQDNNSNRKRKKAEWMAGDDLNDGFDLDDDNSNSDSEQVDIEEEEEEMGIDSSKSTTARDETAIDLDKSLPLTDIVAKEKYDTEKNIPFLFKKCPSTSAELQQLFEGATVEQRDLIMERLLKCFAISLNPGSNKPKLEKLMLIVLTRLERLAKVEDSNLKSAISESDMLLIHIHKLGQKYENNLGNWTRDRLLDAYGNLVSGEQSESLSKLWTRKELLLLRLIGRLYPASDMRHPVNTPLMLLLSEALSLEHMKSLPDIAVGIFVANILLEQLAPRDGFSGELCRFVRFGLQAMSKVKQDEEKPQFHDIIFVEHSKHDKSTTPLNLRDIYDVHTELHRIQVANAFVELANTMMHSGSIPHGDLVFNSISISRMPVSLRERLKDVMIVANRNPLALYVPQKPGLRALNPKMSADGAVFRKRPKSSFVALKKGDVALSASRIRKSLRKEERGMARDARRQAEIDAAQNHRKLQAKRAIMDKKDKQVQAFLETQQATWKAAEKRQKKLSGKKW